RADSAARFRVDARAERDERHERERGTELPAADDRRTVLRGRALVGAQVAAQYRARIEGLASLLVVLAQSLRVDRVAVDEQRPSQRFLVRIQRWMRRRHLEVQNVALEKPTARLDSALELAFLHEPREHGGDLRSTDRVVPEAADLLGRILEDVLR